MQIRILFFGVLKDLAGGASDTLDLPENATVRDTLAHYQSKIPKLKESLPSIAVAVNQRYAGLDTKLRDGDEVALLPPVSGGSDGGAIEGDSAKEEPRRASIVHDRIETARTVESIKQPEDGAVVIFEGIVRNQTRGRKTLYLEYEAYEAMALHEMESLVQQVLKDFAIRNAAIVHRLGRLEIGETSVLIVVVSAHRAAAFEACRWLIDTLKRTVPIWKKEHFQDGAVWVDGEAFPTGAPQANSSHFRS
jgi:molybdopterin converting factor subunit 1